MLDLARKKDIPLPLGDCVVIASKRGEAVGFQSFRMRVFWIMGDHRLSNVQFLQTLGTFESERLKVTALNLFHPTVSPFLRKLIFFYVMTQSLVGEGTGEGGV